MPSLIDIPRKAWICLRRHGLTETLRLIPKNLAEVLRGFLNRRFDTKYRIETAGVVYQSNLTCEGNNQQHAVWYEPTPIKTLKAIFATLPTDLSKFTFVDFGSGKGRAILYASTYGFRRIIGVEFALELHHSAKQNIRSYRNLRQKCFDVESVCTDAAQFELPPGPCVLYFFHPFREEVMRQVLAHIERSYRAHPRKLILLYYHPQMSHVLESAGFLRKSAEPTMPRDITGVATRIRRRLLVYSTRDEAQTAGG